MNLRRLSLALSIALMGAITVHAQGDFFFSFGQGGSNADQTVDVGVGDSGSLWLYWSTNGPADSDLSVGGFIDVFTSVSGVIEFTAAETFDYDLLVANNPSGLTRWNGEGIGPSNNVSADLVNELAGFTITGQGILEANNGSGVFTDAGYNALTDGFEFGRIDFNVIGSGSTTITANTGDGMVVNGDTAIDAVFTSITLNANAVPEPTTAGLLAAGLVGLVSRRRR